MRINQCERCDADILSPRKFCGPCKEVRRVETRAAYKARLKDEMDAIRAKHFLPWPNTPRSRAMTGEGDL